MLEFINHSLIPSYPPDITKYPLFYNCKEYIVILHPGEALYIPPKWFHWVFSYPSEDNTNIALSYHLSSSSSSSSINKKTLDKVPKKYKLDKDQYIYFNYTFDNIKNDYVNKKFLVLKSKKNIIIPVKKPSLKNIIYKDFLTFDDIKKQTREYNIYIGQNNTFKVHKLPNCIDDEFSKSDFKCFYWIASFKKGTEYIDSGLHYDAIDGLLISIKGIKIVRLYHPNEYDNLYVTKMICG